MATDFVFPNNNETEFIEIAEKLGYESLVFVYRDNHTNNDIYNNRNNSFDSNNLQKKVNISNMLIVSPENAQKAKNKGKLIIVKSSERDRWVVEKAKPCMMFGFEELYEKDFIHQRASGLNHILCRLAKKNNIAVGFSFSLVLKNKYQRRAKIIGRMMQNIKLCRKYKVKTIIASFASEPYSMRSPREIIAFFIKTGMHPAEAKNAIEFAEDKTRKRVD